jgi:predicted RNA-binding protein with PIN domain
VRYLIDGHNLLAKLSSIEFGAPNSEAELTLLLRRWTAAGRKRQVIIIFDGGLPGGKDRLLSTSSVNVLFAPRDRTADDLLIARIRKIGNPSEITVISDDREVREATQAKKAVWLSASAFAKRLDSLDEPPNSGISTTEQDMSVEELKGWLELFSGEDGSE